MLRLEGIRLSPSEQESALTEKAARRLRCAPSAIRSLSILRRAVDAREALQFVYTLAVEADGESALLRRCRDKRVSRYTPQEYHLPAPVPSPSAPPVVVGMGPAGLFAALVLAECGCKPIVLERGAPVEQRRQAVLRLWQDGVLDGESNVQFGEGGAGAFSDGKLNTGTKDIRHRFILNTLAQCGAPPQIVYDYKPHIGTDKLYTTLQNLRRRLLALGADLRFGHRLSDIETQGDRLTALQVSTAEGQYRLPCTHAVLALGHSARDTVEMLYHRGVTMEQKPFAVGVRIEHHQSAIDAVQYGAYAGHPSLGAATYKLSCHTSTGRSAFSFCVCPGGQVVAAASEAERTVTNGMSEYARSGANINGALLVNVTPEDFGSTHPLAGIAFQRQLESAAYRLGGGGYKAPCQRVEDFLLRRPTAEAGGVLPSYRPAVTYTELRGCLPPFVSDAIAEALPLLGKKLPGYDAPDALLTAVESRSSSPVKIPRDETGQCNIRGIYPCGEGAGYAGGILSAAADGMRCGEIITEEIRT